jgi:plastocyanin
MANQQVTITPATTKGGPATLTPSPVVAKVGDTVTWINKDTIQHWPQPATGPAWFTSPINPNNSSSPPVPVSTTANVSYFCKLHPSETSFIQASAPEIVRLVIVSGSLPSKTINRNDAAFWFNDTPDKYQLYTIVSGNQIPWGVPPDPLPSKQPSSQVVFPNPGIFVYQCKLHPGQKGTITVL